MENLEIKKIINEFLPDKIFDSHMHLYDKEYMQDDNQTITIENYYSDLSQVFGERKIVANIIPFPSVKIASVKNDSLLQLSDKALYRELDKNPNNVGEILVMPTDDEESILSRFNSKKICGFKCYHELSDKKETFNLDIEEYLPESALALANTYSKVITLHLVKDKSLSDENNLNYIVKMAKKYPNATFILAHAGRSFASWTAVEGVDKVKNLDNVYFDLSAVCESPAIFQIVNKCGTSRVMWGSDYPISNKLGKVISLADKFYWLEKDKFPEINKSVPMLKILEENILAIRQASIMLELKSKDVEDIFYNNANMLLKR